MKHRLDLGKKSRIDLEQNRGFWGGKRGRDGIL